MKKTVLNLILAIVAIAGFIFCVASRGLAFLIGFIPLYAAVVGLIKNNTTWITRY